MKFTMLFIFSIGLFFLSACASFDTRQPEPVPMVVTPQPLALPIGKNWQLIESPPNLSSDQERLPFQTEQSVQPEGAKPIAPLENHKIKSVH